MRDSEVISASDLKKLMDAVEAAAGLYNAVEAKGTAFAGEVAESFLTLGSALWDLGLKKVS